MAQVNLQVRLDAETRAYEKALLEASRATKALWAETDRVSESVGKLERELARGDAALKRALDDRAEARAKGLETLGRSLLAVGAAGAVGLGLAAKAAIDWETAWAGVNKTVNGSEEQLAALESGLRDLAKVLPASQTEIAGVAEAAGQLGIKRPDILKFTRVMLDLGITTNLTARDAAVALAKLTNVMGTPISQIDRLGATLVDLGNNSATTESEILTMATRISGAGKLVGATEAEVLALASALSSMGIEAELGGGSMTRVLQNIYVAVQNGGPRLEAFARIAGTTATQFAKDFRDAPVKALDSFTQGLNRVDAAGGNVVTALKSVGIQGTLDVGVVLRLKGANDLLSDSLDLANAAWESNTALMIEAERRYETTASKIQVAKNQINDAAITIGETLLPAIATATTAVAGLADLFAAIPGWMKPVVTIIGAIGTTAALAAGAFLLAVPKIAAYREALEGMGPRTQRLAGLLSRTAAVLAGPLAIGLVAGVAALTIYTKRKQEATAKSEEFRATLDEETGALTEGSRALVARRLQEEGVLSSAEKLGVATWDVVDAALGNAEATERVNAALLVHEDRLSASADAVTATSAAEHELGREAIEVGRAINGQNEEIVDAVTKHRQMREATEGTADASGKLGESARTTASALDRETEAAARLKSELDRLNGIAQDVESANVDFRASLDDLVTSVDKGSKSLNINTEKGRENRTALLRVIKAAQEHARAVEEQTGSADKGTAALRSHKAELIKVADQSGLSERAARRYIERLLQIPPKQSTKIETPGMEAAKRDVDSLAYKLEHLPRRKYIDIVTRAGFASGQVDYFGGRKAAGGLITGPGGPIDDTAGLFALSNREFVQPARAVDYYGASFMEAVRTLRYPRFAAGGMVSVTPPRGVPTNGGVTVNVNVNDTTGITEQAVKRAAMTGVAQALALR